MSTTMINGVLFFLMAVEMCCFKARNALKPNSLTSTDPEHTAVSLSCAICDFYSVVCF